MSLKQQDWSKWMVKAILWSCLPIKCASYWNNKLHSNRDNSLKVMIHVRRRRIRIRLWSWKGTRRRIRTAGTGSGMRRTLRSSSWSRLRGRIAAVVRHRSRKVELTRRRSRCCWIQCLTQIIWTLEIKWTKSKHSSLICNYWLINKIFNHYSKEEQKPQTKMVSS